MASKPKQTVTSRETDAGYEITHALSKITYRLLRRPRGFSFVDAPPFLHGTFVHLDTAKAAFGRYVDMILDREAIANNPLIHSDEDRTKGTFLDPKVRYGPPPSLPHE